VGGGRSEGVSRIMVCIVELGEAVLILISKACRKGEQKLSK